MVENKLNKLPTAYEYVKNHYEIDVRNHFLNFNRDGEQTYEEYAKLNPLKTLEEGFIEFAKLHVTEALESAADNAMKMGASKDTIKASYSLFNIK